MDGLVERLAIALHDNTDCEHPFYSHTEASQESWRQQARLAIDFIKRSDCGRRPDKKSS